ARRVGGGTGLGRRAGLIERRAALVGAEFAYETLTGMRTRPPALVETPVEERDFSAHPLLTLARTEAERARAALELSARAAKGSPSLTIGPRRQRDALADYYTDSVGIEVSIPVGGGAHADAETASARRVGKECGARWQPRHHKN